MGLTIVYADTQESYCPKGNKFYEWELRKRCPVLKFGVGSSLSIKKKEHHRRGKTRRGKLGGVP